eukprot:g3201.t1
MVTRVVSLFTVKPSFKEATFEKLLKAFPIGYGGILDDSIGEDKGSSVCLEIPSCTFLSRARKVYDDDAKGNRACINE